MLFGVCSFDLGLDQASKEIVDVPSRAKPLALPQLYDDLIGCGSTQSVHVDPSDPREQFPDLFIGLLVPLFIAFALQRSPEGAIRPRYVLLNGASAHSKDRWIGVATELLVCQHCVQPVKLEYELIFLWWKFLVDT